MVCEPQPAAGECAVATIDYANKAYSIDAQVLGQDLATEPNRPLVGGAYGGNLVRAADGLRLNEPRPVGQVFSVSDSGETSGLSAIARDDTSDPLQLSFDVTNPSTAHEMIGGGFASINFDFDFEYGASIPILRIYGTNTANNGLVYLPLPVEPVAGNTTRAGMSVTVAIGPRAPIDPGESWADTISFEVLAGLTPNINIRKWTARVEGILL